MLNTTRDRQEELQKTYYFLCECPRCLEPEPMAEMTGAACPDPKCDFYIDVNMVLPGDKCKKCGEVVTEEFLERYKEVMEFTTTQIESMKQFTCILTCLFAVISCRTFVCPIRYYFKLDTSTICNIN